MSFLHRVLPRGIFFVSGAVLVGLCGSARAVPVVDQSFFIPTPGFAYIIGGGYIDSEILPVGLTGTLTEVDLQAWQWASTTGTVSFEVRKMLSDGPPDDLHSLILGQATLQTSDFPIITSAAAFPKTVTLATIDLSAQHIHVDAGERIAISATSDVPDLFPNGDFLWAATNQGVDGYPAGDAWTYFNNANSIGWYKEVGARTVDRGFQTFIDTAPEPTSIATLVIAAPALLRRRGFGARIRR
ncbi:MAG TPA: hypothetical protein VM008_14025 [Phycisphaerae bacterium]|nr:hypothetical protein [Phycisphaerae bacterium]